VLEKPVNPAENGQREPDAAVTGVLLTARRRLIDPAKDSCCNPERVRRSRRFTRSGQSVRAALQNYPFRDFLISFGFIDRK
jgi:hypothetical protein